MAQSMRQAESTDVIIIGGGILGLSLAYHLRTRKLRTILLEREYSVGKHASGKNAGMLRHLYRHPQLTDWAISSLSRLPKAIKDRAFTATGSLIIGRDVPHHHPELFTASVYRAANSSREHPPQLGIPAVFTRADGLLDSQRLMSVLYELTYPLRDPQCHSLNRIIFNANVSHLEQCGSDIEVMTNLHHSFRAPIVVNAAGAWVNRFAIGCSVPIECYARHLFVVDGFEDAEMPVNDVGYVWHEGSEWYVRHWTNNSRLISLCDQLPADPDSQLVGQDRTAAVIETARQFTSSRTLEVRNSWHCFRTYTEDQLPIWGFDERIPGLFWLAAFGGFGMSTGFGAAYDAAEAIAGRCTAHRLSEIESQFGVNRLIPIVDCSTVPRSIGSGLGPPT